MIKREILCHFTEIKSTLSSYDYMSVINPLHVQEIKRGTNGFYITYVGMTSPERFEETNEGIWQIFVVSQFMPFDQGGGNLEGLIGSNQWFNNTIRRIVPDRISVSIGANIAIVLGVGQNFELNWITKGKDARWFPYLTNTRTFRRGIEGDVGIQANLYWFVGPQDQINKAILLGPSRDWDGGWIYGGSLYRGLDEDGTPIWRGFGSGVGMTVGVSFGSGGTRKGLNDYPVY